MYSAEIAQRQSRAGWLARDWPKGLLVILLILMPADLQAAEKWVLTGLNTLRSYHTVTALPDGRVLVTGGRTQHNFWTSSLSNCEVYDPAAGRWTVTGHLLHGLHSHSATLLEDGRVLVAGGFWTTPSGTPVPISGAQLFDPLSGEWSVVAPMSVPRFSHTAVRLRDGRVLVIGGGAPIAMHSAEIYDPASGSWERTADLRVARSDHTATLLSDGRVLVSGGKADAGLVATTEIYDPESASWQAARSLKTARMQHTATLLPDGRVLVVGGQFGEGLDNFNRTELFNPDLNSWEVTANPSVPRHGHDAALLGNGRVLVAGGFHNRSYLDLAEIFDPELQQWRLTARLNTPRTGLKMISLAGGGVLAVGGWSSREHNTAEVFDPGRILFPQLALGGGFQVSLFLTNLDSDAWTGQAVLDAGDWPSDRQWTLDGEDRTGASEFDIRLEAGQSRKYVLSSPEGQAFSGWLEIVGDFDVKPGALIRNLLYEFRPSNELLASVAVASSKKVFSARFPAERTKWINTGLAVRASGGPLAFSLYDSAGDLAQSVIAELDGAHFFDELFQNVPAGFSGFVAVTSDQPFYLVVLRQELTPSGFQLTSVPATAEFFP